MSGQSASEMVARLRRVAAVSGPAVMIAVPVVVAFALLLRGADLSFSGRPKDVTMAGGAPGSLLLSAVNGSPQGRGGKVSPKVVSAKTAPGVRSAGIRPVSLRHSPRLATMGQPGVPGWSGPGGSAAAERSSIQAQLVYERTTTACPSLAAAINRGGLEGALAVAISGAEATALRRGASEAETQSLIRRSIQSVLIASGAAPRDVLGAVQDLSGQYVLCGGDPTALAVLGGLGGVIRAQLNYSEPAAVGGPGPAPIGNPVVPLPGGLGTASYLQQGQGR
jgi:hypothetical protein